MRGGRGVRGLRPDSNRIDELLAIDDLFSEIEKDGIRILGSSFGGKHSPYLWRVVEDMAIEKLYFRYREMGESKHHSIVRTAKQVGLTDSGIYYRLDRLGI